MDVLRPLPVIVWYRLDLRISDHPGLCQAELLGAPVVPVFIWDPEAEGPWAPGRVSRRWLAGSLRALDGELRKRGSRLLFREGVTEEVLLRLAAGTGARDIHYSRRYEPLVEARDGRLAASLAARGLRLVRHGGNLLREPESLQTQAGGPFKVFTPFWRALQAQGDPQPPLAAPRHLPQPHPWSETPGWDVVDRILAGGDASGAGAVPRPGEAAARKALGDFLANALEDYPEARDVPADPGTSRLSPHLHFGEITPRQVWHAALKAARGVPAAAQGRLRQAASVFLKELGWREFAHHVLVHFPHTPDQPLRKEFAAFPWTRDRRRLELWRQGNTGYPFVDAGMRELAATGTMHNRVRMAAASFLVKDLLVPWQDGARWFWESLADADLAVNTLNWQWVAGCGADAAPYFRIFNPVTQGMRFDPHGDYVRRWVPELAEAPASWIHRPFAARPLELAAAGLEPGRGYPGPLVDHALAREDALAAFRSL